MRFRRIAWGIALAATGTVARSAADVPPVPLSPRELEQRGVLFYAPFEGTAEAIVAGGQAEPWLERRLEFRPGRVGQAVFVTREGGQHGSSMLAYEAAGNIDRRRGTLAFWVKTPWDGRDRDILTGSTFGGPYILGISSDEGSGTFFHFWRRKTFFDVNFHGTFLGGDRMRLQQRWNRDLFGDFSGRLVGVWEKDVWQHVAVTWDDRRGWHLFFNGEHAGGFDGDIEWDLFEPDTMALGHRPLRSRDVWPVTGDFGFDEFMILMRPLDPGEVRAVMEGDYGRLRPVEPEDWAFDAAARRRSVKLEPNDGRPAVAVREGAARIAFRQVPVEALDMHFFGGFKLVDGDPGTGVQFRDGGIPFETPVWFRFFEPARVDLVVADASDPRESFFFENDASQPAAALQQGRTYLRRPGDATRAGFGVHFEGDATAEQVAFYRRAEVSDGAAGRAYPLRGRLPAGRYGDAEETLLREATHPSDRLVLAAGDGAGEAVEAGALVREPLAHTFFVLDAGDQDRFVDRLHLKLPVRTRGPFSAAFRIFDPLIPRHVNYHATFSVTDFDGREPVRLDVEAGPIGLIVPAGGQLVAALTADEALEIVWDGEGRIEIVEGDPGRIGREFATVQLRRLWPAYLRRINQNRFIRPGETEESSHLFQGLARALRYDPGNRQAGDWLHWGRFEPWPEYDFSDVEAAPGPRWAAYLREAVQSKQAIIHWWLDHRSTEDAYLAGPGDQWNDITKLYNKFLSLGATVSDTRLIDAVERYLDAHWNTGRMVDGYIWHLTDMTHSCEEASYIQPALHVLRPGVPRHVYRDLRTASNLRTWMGVNPQGSMLFRSNQFNAREMETGGVFGRDVSDADSATVPAKFLFAYNGHPACGAWIRARADAWLEATRAAGGIPAAIDFATGQPLMGGGGGAELFVSAYQVSGDPRYLVPLAGIAAGRLDAPGGRPHFRAHARPFLARAVLDGDAPLEPALREAAEARMAAIAGDVFFQRGIENGEALPALLWLADRREEDLIELLRFVARNNRRAFSIYTSTEPPTDRVYPWGRSVLPLAMLGGRLFDGRAANPMPSAAFAWEGTDTDVVSLVTGRGRDRLAMRVYNFKRTGVRAGLRVIDLPEGRYRMRTFAWDEAADRPAGPSVEADVELRRFTAQPIDLPPRQTLRVELDLLEARPRRRRPDLAVTLAAPVRREEGTVTARVHNLGGAASERTEVRLMLDGEVLARAEVAAVPALSGFDPQFVDIVLRPPADAALDAAVLVVDPDGEVDEINESNNSYPLRRGVPPAVETQRPPWSGRDGMVEVRW